MRLVVASNQLFKTAESGTVESRSEQSNLIENNTNTRSPFETRLVHLRLIVQIVQATAMVQELA